MRDPLERQTGRVALIGGPMSGFAPSVAAHVPRHGIRSRPARAVFPPLLLTPSCLLPSLRVDTRPSIELAGREALAPDVARALGDVRAIGTIGARPALFLFVVPVGTFGRLATPPTGFPGTAPAGT